MTTIEQIELQKEYLKGTLIFLEGDALIAAEVRINKLNQQQKELTHD